MKAIHYTALLSLLINLSNATDTIVEGNEDISNWVATYHVFDNEGTAKSSVTHTPERVCLDYICAKSIIISSKAYNGIPLTNPIVISVDMEKPEFEGNLSFAGLTFKEVDA